EKPLTATTSKSAASNAPSKRNEGGKEEEELPWIQEKALDLVEFRALPYFIALVPLRSHHLRQSQTHQTGLSRSSYRASGSSSSSFPLAVVATCRTASLLLLLLVVSDDN
ncbi:hypothetical protein PIB30_073044, partial [Stylosanthes scabra]|nr:hypothetical protein [Stylosanthes scabra]